MDLWDCLRDEGLVPVPGAKGEGRLLAFVGGGGKTTAIFHLAEAARRRGLAVIVTTTTAMRDPRSEAGRPIDDFLESMPTAPVAAGRVAYLAFGTVSEGKVGGPAASECGALKSKADLVLVEADGSRGLPLKAPGDHEPVLPPTSDAVLASFGMDVLGRPATADRVHRLPAFLQVSGLGEGRAIGREAIAALASSPAGFFKGAPESASRILLMTRADLVEEEEGFGHSAAIAASLPGRCLLLRSGREGDSAWIVRKAPLLVVRGAGDLATGVILALRNSGYRVVALESPRPSAIRRTVALSEAVYEGRAEVEGVEARLVRTPLEALDLLSSPRLVPLLVDPSASSLGELRPDCLVDAIIAKRNLGTGVSMAPLVIALGPGFEAGRDAHLIVETNRGHDLGRLLASGSAEPDTGTPGEIGGAAGERVVHAEKAGSFTAREVIGSFVRSGQLIGNIVNSNDNFTVCSKLDGILRGILRDGYEVTPGFKVADVDPRASPSHCLSISDKSRALGRAVLEALLSRGFVP